jgi:hypothetical protein
MSKTLSEAANELGKNIKDFFEVSRTSNDASSLDELKSFLEKARRRMSDEVDPFGEDQSEVSEDQGFREFDPDVEEGDDADKWLESHDPVKGDNDDEEDAEPSEDYDEYTPDEDEESHQQVPQLAEEAAEPGATEGDPAEGSPQTKEEVKGESRFPQPSKEEIAEMRGYTRPWESRARDKARLEAEAHKNPVLHHEGRLVEARNQAHKDRQDAYAKFQASPDYQNADPISQMEMDANFHKDYQEKNPEHLKNAVKLHERAHLHGLRGHEEHAAQDLENVKHVRGGGAQAEEPMSVEEGMQHAGGAKGEEGTVGAMVKDPSASFASANKDFLRERGAEFEEKAGARQESRKGIASRYAKNVGDMPEYDRSDVHSVLGDHPALKDPKNKAKVEAFFEKYHPLIGINAHKVLNKLGLNAKSGDIDMGTLHEAGMHGLMQAINDYEHENPSKASFSTHASNKIHGLQQTAMRDQMSGASNTMRQGAKKFNLQSTIGKHPPDVADRLKRIQTARQTNAPKPPKTEGGGQQ